MIAVSFADGRSAMLNSIVMVVGQTLLVSVLLVVMIWSVISSSSSSSRGTTREKEVKMRRRSSRLMDLEAQQGIDGEDICRNPGLLPAAPRCTSGEACLMQIQRRPRRTKRQGSDVVSTMTGPVWQQTKRPRSFCKGCARLKGFPGAAVNGSQARTLFSCLS